MDRPSLNPSDEDDLYSGYNEYPSVFSTNNLQEDEDFLEAVRTSYDKRPTLLTRPGIATRLGTPSGYRQGTALASSRGLSRLNTRGNEGGARPMTAVRGAGYTSGTSVFDPLNQASKGMSSAEQKKEDSPRKTIKQLEKQINTLIDESYIARSRGELKVALDKAKNACKKERSMVRLQEQTGSVNARNEELNFACWRSLKTKVSKKVNAIHLAQRSTGNEMLVQELTELERKVLGIIGHEYVEEIDRPLSKETVIQSHEQKDSSVVNLSVVNSQSPQETREDAGASHTEGAVDDASPRRKVPSRKRTVRPELGMQHEDTKDIFVQLSKANNENMKTLLNLANQYEANEMYSEALSTYQSITRNRVFPNVKRFNVNMGNIYLKMGQYPKAIKFYQMALDHVPEIYKSLRIKITHNIGLLFVKMGQYQDACTSFEYIMQEKPDFKTGLHLVLCYYALGDVENMKRAFQLMLIVPLDIDDDKYSAASDDPASNLLLEVIKTDRLSKMEKQAKEEAERCILTAARVISPAIGATPGEGYDWCIQALRTVMPTQHSSNLSVSTFHSNLADELEVHKAAVQLKGGDLQGSVSTLSAFAKRGDTGRVSSIACTNLAFIYFLQGDIDQAEKYADLARQADTYNAAAFVNLGNCSFSKGDVERAKELYICSLENDASCVEALYNLGLAHKNQGMHEDALDCFLKLNAIVKHHPEVLYMLAYLHELLGDKDQATEWYLLLLGIVPSDPGILQKVGQLYENDGDRQLAHQYHIDSHRYFPSNLDVIEWLGSYYISMQLPEKAISYFEKAALLCPDEVKWHLMVASCHRRSGSYQQALQLYRQIHQRFPDNVECLKFLVRLCSDLGLKEAIEYAAELKKAEKAKDVRERIGSSRPGSWRSSGRSSRVGTAYVDNDGTGRPNSNRNTMQSRHGAGGESSFSPLAGFQMRHRYSSRGFYPLKSANVYTCRTNRSCTPSPYVNFIDNQYSDVSRPQSRMERPRTSAGMKNHVEDDDFGDEELGIDLLPE